MSNILFRIVIFLKHSINHLRITPQKQKYFFLKFFTKTSICPPFEVSYLVNLCGLSLESAVSVSKYVKFENPNKPNAVVEFLKNRNFSQTQISIIVKRMPSLLVSNPEKTRSPKFDFFLSKGVTHDDLIKILRTCPFVLNSSLERLIPNFEICRGIFQCDEKVVSLLKRSTDILKADLEGTLLRNMEILRENGVPDKNIVALLQDQPRAMLSRPVLFEKDVMEVTKMRMDPLQMKFVNAVLAFRSMSKSTMRTKVEAYMQWGLSKDEVMLAFKKSPWCMMALVEQIMAVMDFLVNKMGLGSSAIVQHPGLMNLSLKKRVFPRASFYEVLLSKGLLQKNFNLVDFLYLSEKSFLKKYVSCHKEEASMLLQIYKEKLSLAANS